MFSIAKYFLVYLLPALVSYLVLNLYRSFSKQVEVDYELLKVENKIFSSDIEVIAQNLAWAEGPLWISDKEQNREYLLYSDVMNNRVWKWEVENSIFLEPSGCSDSVRCGKLKEPGSNGLKRLPAILLPNKSGVYVAMCNHGERQVSLLFPDGIKIPLATHYRSKQLNSPNDLVFNEKGDLYFTDPPYGLNLLDTDPDKELEFSGVYRIKAETISKRIDMIHQLLELGTNRSRIDVLGETELLEEPELLCASMTRPNGIAFSRNHKKLYVANSDYSDPHWRIFDVQDDGSLSNDRIFYDATEMIKSSKFGIPDGMTVDKKGNIFAAGPGGMHVFSEDGELLESVPIESKTSNVALGNDGYAYITAHTTVLRAKLKDFD